MAIFLSLTFIPFKLNAAAAEPSSLVAPKPSESAEAKNLELRLNEIKAMDKTELKSSEKKALRKEVKSINHRLRELGGGVYVSVAALVLIIILLVVLL